MRAKRLTVFWLAILLVAGIPAFGANRVKTWSSEILTFVDLNAEFNNAYSGTIDRDAGRWGSLDDIPVTFGSGQDVQIEWDTAQSFDLLLIGLAMGEGSGIMLVDKADMATNFAIATRSNPTLFIHSADATSVTEYLEMQHDGTDVKLNVGSGGLLLQIAGTTATTLTSAGSGVSTFTGASDVTWAVPALKGIFLKAGTKQAALNDNADFYPVTDNNSYLGVTGTNRWKDIYAVTKTSVLDVPWTPTKKVMVAVAEGPEYRLYDTGTVTLTTGGTTTVTLDPHFVDVVNLAMPWQVTTSGAEVTTKSSNGFTLKGRPGQVVDWAVSAVRAGFENVRWRDPSGDEPRGLQDPWAAIKDKDQNNNTPREKQRYDVREPERRVVQ